MAGNVAEAIRLLAGAYGLTWFCLYTTPAGERRAAYDTQDMGIAHIASGRPHPGGAWQRQERLVPLLPRYLFVAVDDAMDLCGICEIATVQEVLPHEHEPIAIPDYQVEQLTTA